jgi:transcriptional regulator with XRE-family HTH domain
MDISEIGELLRAARIERRLTQEELARMLGFDVTTVARAEKGRDETRSGTLTEMARALNLELMLVPRYLVPAVRAMTGSSRSPVPALQRNEEDYTELTDRELADLHRGAAFAGLTNVQRVRKSNPKKPPIADG